MLAKHIRRTFILWVVGIIATIGLSGCFKGEIAVDVKQNGSGIISLAFGMTQQAKAFAASQGTNPFQDINKSLANGTDTPKDVKVTTWIDGDYEWTKAEKEFANLDEINQVLNRENLFNNFSLTRNHNLLQDEFTLQAEFAPLNGNTSGNDSGIDPSAFIQMSFSARLPGKIIETNGLTDINDPNRMVWNMESKQSVPIRARSVAWNWMSILVISGFLLFLGVVAVGGVGYSVHASSHRNKNLNKSQPVLTKQITATDFAELGIEGLFLRINEKVLDSVGQIQERPGGIALVWKNVRNQEKLIDIKALEGDQISINDKVYAATKEDAKSGIIDALRNQVKK